MKHFVVRALLPAALLATFAIPASAQSAGEWTFGVGVHQIDPRSNNGAVADGALELDVGSSARPTITAEYFLRDGLGIEVLAALPFQHDIAIRGAGRVATARHLPPTVSLQYHFSSGGRVSPFVGAGVNYTTFFDEDTTGLLAGTDLELEDSWGLAAHAGVDFAVGEHGALRVDARWIDIDSEVRVDGAKIGTAEIDPLVYGVAYVFRF